MPFPRLGNGIFWVNDQCGRKLALKVSDDVKITDFVNDLRRSDFEFSPER